MVTSNSAIKEKFRSNILQIKRNNVRRKTASYARIKSQVKWERKVLKIIYTVGSTVLLFKVFLYRVQGTFVYFSTNFYLVH